MWERTGISKDINKYVTGRVLMRAEKKKMRARGGGRSRSPTKGFADKLTFEQRSDASEGRGHMDILKGVFQAEGTAKLKALKQRDHH